MKYHVNAIIDDEFWQVVKHEKMQEGDFEVESSMSFDGSHWCQSTLDLEHRTTNVNQNRSTASPEHRSMTPTESSASCNTVRIMTHEDFTVRHPHPPSPVYVNIDRQTDPAIYRQPPSPIDRRAPLTASRKSIDHKVSTLIDIRSQPPSAVREKGKLNNNYLTPDEYGIFRDPEGYARAIDGYALQVSREDIADILQMANGAENLFMQQRNIPEHQQRVTNKFYDTSGGVDDRFKPKYRQHTRPLIDFGDPTSIDKRPEFGKRAYDRD
ncbi:hypothetical protein F2Q68_00039802 [Brassica cretica]|uniref:Uncharacterized protein n=1 Tax=Brassica cretica TaxID=69181 RepID=A0A8S9MJ57_BRACR|nr:hypothetical protein F2Q68_00039802 [Brassica cretica]